MTPTSKRRIYCATLTIAATGAGLVWRLAPLHLPWFAFKYGGSALWAIAVYWLVATAFPAAQTRTMAAIAALIALLVELSRLLHFPLLNHFRETLAGKLILGRYFSPRNIAAYWLAIAAVALLDHHYRRRAASHLP